MRSCLFSTSFFIFLFVVVLTSCSETSAVKTVHFEPPGTPGGRLCINQCRDARDYCLKDCELEQRRCTIIMQTQAMKDYEAYAKEQLAAKAPLELFPRDFEKPESCSQDPCKNKCDNKYKSCYEACGGKVIISSSCSFLCF